MKRALTIKQRTMLRKLSTEHSEKYTIGGYKKKKQPKPITLAKIEKAEK
jgi:hypothetical protein